MSYTLPPIEKFCEIPESQQVEALAHLFEPCATLSKFITDNVLTSDASFSTYKDLIENIRTQLSKFLASEEVRSQGTNTPINPDISKIIAAHPRLGPAKQSTGALSVHSSSEQKSLAGTEKEAKQLFDLNEEYESTFPGLKYVVFVNGRSRSVIMENMRQRIDRGNIMLERKEAFNAMCDIALDRARKLGAKL